jgi:hypothetical protein
VTMGGMLQRHTSNRQMGSGQMSGPWHGYISAKIKRT